MALYTRLLGVGAVAVADGLVTAFTVPVGHTFIVRDITVFVAADTNMLVFDATHGVVMFALTTLPGGNTSQWRGRQVFDAGNILQVKANGGSFQYRISGYDFSTP